VVVFAVYFFTGKLGSGKTLCAVGRIREYLQQGRRIATNLDLHLEAFCRPDSRPDVIRLPDKPRLEDLELLGRGCEEEDEKRYGLIVLDELGTWFNTRNWRDKERLPLIDWFLHARKKHWDIIFIIQDIDSVDNQLRNALCEHLVVCRRLDRVNIPVISKFFSLAGVTLRLPKIHAARVYYGDTESALLVDRWIYRGRDLYAAYETAQIFSDQLEVLGGEVVDMRTTYTCLPPYYTTGWHGLRRLEEQYQTVLKSFPARETLKPKSSEQRSAPAFRSGRIRAAAVFCLSVLFVGAGTLFNGRVSSGNVSASPSPGAVSAPALVASAAPMALPSQALPAPVAPALPSPEADEVVKLFGQYESRFRIFTYDGATMRGVIGFYRDRELKGQFSLDRMIFEGWALRKTDVGVVVSKPGRSYFVAF
jgi:hypothetical protein